jgi:hypothetical protein
MRSALIAVVSVLVGVVVSVLTNLITTEFTWPLLAGLVSAVVVWCVVVLQSRGAEQGDDGLTAAIGTGAVAIGGPNYAPVRVEVSGSLRESAALPLQADSGVRRAGQTEQGKHR